MVDFESLISGTRPELTYDLPAIYSTLDVKSTHTELRPAQKEALSELTNRYAEKDLVLKISTGAGKTTVGLLYLYGHMRVSRQPVVYLCPTTQLVEQVLEEAERLGISAKHYARSEKYPDPACVRGDAIIVCTYEKMFNAKSTFHRHDVNITPVAIVLDDAHAGVEIVRKQFTLKLRDAHFDAVAEILEPSCRKYNRTKWHDIEGRDPQAYLEVPHWIWADSSRGVQDELHQFAGDGALCFVWPYLEDILPLCRCVVGPGDAEISPEVIPTDKVRSFSYATHRLFMSATLVDDSVLTRELGASTNATSNPIEPPSDRGMGERMIIAPSLVDPEFTRPYAMVLCAELSKSRSVVVLTSSEPQAREWEAAGAAFYAGDNFAEGVKSLKVGLTKFAVFAQRYDGVDLPDDSCRVLVIDGIPYGESLIDKSDAQLSLSPGGVRNRTIFRIEQGMGRAVRSHADFAVVLLVGQDVATFVGRQDVLSAMTPDTRNQLSLSVELATLSRNSNPSDPKRAVVEIIHQCLNRDPGWKAFYNARVREASGNKAEINLTRIALADTERESYRLATVNMVPDGVSHLRKAINDSGLNEEELGIYLQRLSRIAYLVDPVDAMRIQQGARGKSINVAIPPTVPKRPQAPTYNTASINRFCEWFKSFSQPNAAVIAAKRIVDQLDLHSNHKIIEAAIKELGNALGAESSRPEEEFGEGPDNLWFWGDRLYVIEAKNENEVSLHKKDAGQLHVSLQWASESYPTFAGRMVPLTVAKVTKPDSDAHYPDGVRVITQKGLDEIGSALHNLCQKLAMQGSLFVNPNNVERELAEFNLLPEQFINAYTSRLD